MAKKAKKETVKYWSGTGRRKDSIARVRILPGKGQLIINGKEAADFFNGNRFFLLAAESPLTFTKTRNKYDVFVKVEGGGASGQAGAIRHGISRTLIEADETLKDSLKKGGFLTRDPRMKERRKYGLKKARKAPQFSKR